MKKILYLLFLMFAMSYAQDQASNWYFGENAGIQFNTITGATTTLTNGRLFTDEGCTSISDVNGNLLFYTDGIIVFDRNHNIMLNGNNLKGSPSSTQSAIIIPKPDDINIYYIFTVDTSFLGSIDEGFHFSEVDITLNGGFGGVTANKNIRLLNNTSEKLSAVLKDCETSNIWVITFADLNGGENNNTFYAYEVSNTGVNQTPVVSPAGININERRGYLKFSPDGTKLVCANISQGLFMFDFDTTTGNVDNMQQIAINFNRGSQKPQSPYGLEFSPDSQLLYVTTYFETPQADFNNPAAQYGALLQYEVNAPDISASEIVIDDRQMYRSAIQLAPNGKIYRSLSETYFIGTPFLSTIDVPNAIGTACNYQHATVDLNGRNSRQGLPPFISSFFTEKVNITGDVSETTYLPLCDGEIFTLFGEEITGATYTWYKDGVLLAETDYDLEISEDGTYELLIELDSSDCETQEGEAIVEYFTIPIANQPQDMDEFCDDNNDETWSFDFTIQDANVLDLQDAGTYSVHYYRNQIDADDDENEITTLFENTANPQTIFARIQNRNNPNCYDTTNFQIRVFNTPTANSIGNFTTCDDAADTDDTNGQINVLLTDFNNIVLDTQSETDYTVTYHNSQANADAGSPALPDTYYTQTPFNETVFVRIENKLNTECYDTTSFDVIVNPLPNRFISNLIQCDEDGTVDGRTVFNLTEATDDLTGSATNVSVKFYRLFVDAQNENNEVDGSNFPNTINPQIIYALVTDNTTECSVITELYLEVSTTQILDYSAPEVCDELGSEDGNNTFNLDDFTTDIQTINGIAFPITYFENYSDALVEQNQLASPYTNTTSYSQTIYARAENNNACYGISEVTITVNQLPQLLEDETILYCLNSFPETITLQSGVIGNPDNFTYSWSTGETTNEIQINEIGNYTVTITNANNCDKQRVITVEASNIATIDAVEVIDGSQNNTVTIEASGEGIYEYALYDFEGVLYATYQPSNVFTNVYPGIYTIAVKDIKNDCGIIEQLISVIGFPQFFTPNNDGYHDTWQVLGISSQFQPNTKIKIFNRFGKLLKQIAPLTKGWDGTFNGDFLPNDDYWFIVTLQDGREYVNHFTLKR